MPQSESIEAFWARFLMSDAAAGLESRCLYDSFAIGADRVSADAGAALILAGKKIATSCLPCEFDGTEQGPPYVGALSILKDGQGRPVAVVETKEVVMRRVDELDEDFARDYGEWDLTAATLKRKLLGYYGPQAEKNGEAADASMALICERFQVIWRG